MAFNFKEYEGVELEVLGTAKSTVGAGGKLRFTPKSYSDATKQLCVIMMKKDGTSDIVTCSAAVTKACRKAFDAGMTKSGALASIMNLDIIESTNGGNYISAPKGESGEGEAFTIMELNKESEAVTYEELIAF